MPRWNAPSRSFLWIFSPNWWWSYCFAASLLRASSEEVGDGVFPVVVYDCGEVWQEWQGQQMGTASDADLRVIYAYLLFFSRNFLLIVTSLLKAEELEAAFTLLTISWACFFDCICVCVWWCQTFIHSSPYDSSLLLLPYRYLPVEIDPLCV